MSACFGRGIRAGADGLGVAIALSGKYSSEMFNRRGKWISGRCQGLGADPHVLSGQLRNIAKLRYWGLKDVLTDKYLLDPEEAAKLASFLLPMVRIFSAMVEWRLLTRGASS